MPAEMDQLKTFLHDYIDLNHAEAVLDWDQQTNMPAGGAEDRSDQLATISRMAHGVIGSPELGRLLDDLQGEVAGLDPGSDQAALFYVVKRLYRKETHIPLDWVARFSRATSRAFEAWVKARAESNFTLFQPFLEEVVSLRQEYARFFAPYDHLYDPLLDDFEPGLKTAEVQAIFSVLRTEQVALIHAIRERPEPDTSFLNQPLDITAQRQFSIEVTQKLGYDWNRGRLDIAAHPFTTSFGQGDVRITTRFDAGFLPSALFGTIHETGHALYEQGLHPRYRRTLLSTAASMAFHESQSRLYENLVGRSRAFWQFFYPRLQTYFPGQFENVPLEAFYQAINKVAPSLIRVEADEATYNLHIMLRMELEIGLMEGSMRVKDLPEAWNDRVRAYLGLTPPDDARGVLQDIHWSQGYFGYFPTYALGNLLSAQIWEKMAVDIPDLNQHFERGEFDALLAWLRKYIHQMGAIYQPQDLAQRVTGSRIDSAPYLRYLKRKFGGIYHL
jgi:carboxypeptidase Taq